MKKGLWLVAGLAVGLLAGYLLFKSAPNRPARKWDYPWWVR
jgi:hypothetical protein